MPRISEFYGIVIYLYWADVNRHAAPHFHARYAEHEAVFSIPEARILTGSLPRRQVVLVQGWAALYEEELEQAWERAVNKQPPGTIPPLTK
jgi:hypothetical protein